MFDKLATLALATYTAHHLCGFAILAVVLALAIYNFFKN